MTATTALEEKHRDCSFGPAESGDVHSARCLEERDADRVAAIEDPLERASLAQELYYQREKAAQRRRAAPRGLNVVTLADLRTADTKPKHARPVQTASPTQRTASNHDGPGPSLAWGKDECVWFPVKRGPDAMEASDTWLNLFLANVPSTQMDHGRVEQFAITLHDYARARGVTRFRLRDADAAKLAGLTNVNAWQYFRKLLHRTRWADIRVGTSRTAGKCGVKTQYTLTMPSRVVLAQSGAQSGAQS